MKKSKSFLVFVLFGVSIMGLQANVTVPKDERCSNEIVVLSGKKKPNKPKAPARYHVECSYSIGYMRFSFPLGVSYMRVVISESDVAIWEGSVTPDVPAIDIPVLSGEYTVTCITNEGAEYSGSVYFGDEITEN